MKCWIMPCWPKTQNQSLWKGKGVFEIIGAYLFKIMFKEFTEGEYSGAKKEIAGIRPGLFIFHIQNWGK